MNEAKGYFTSSGYVGFVNGKEMLFASETDYYEYLGGSYEV